MRLYDLLDQLKAGKVKPTVVGSHWYSHEDVVQVYQMELPDCRVMWRPRPTDPDGKGLIAFMFPNGKRTEIVTDVKTTSNNIEQALRVVALT